MDINNIITYRNRAVNAGIIILAISISYAMYMKQMGIIEGLKEAKDKEIKRTTTLGGIHELEKRVKLYRDFVNKKEPTALVNSFNNIARESGITITSFKPGKPQDFPMYSKNSFSVTVTAKTFGQMGKFISRIESSPDIFIIESAVVNSGGRSEEGSSGNLINADLTVCTVIFK